jgi:hypothetical protein
MLLMSEEKAKALGLKPIARILGFADAEQAPIDFTTTYVPGLGPPTALGLYLTPRVVLPIIVQSLAGHPQGAEERWS